jgi:predicted dehydrogenase
MLPEIDLVAVCDVDRDTAEQAKEKCHVPACYTDPVEMITYSKLDIVTVATPVNTHFPIMKELAATSVRGIFLEKPVTANLREARELQSIYRGCSKSVMVNMYRRFDNIHQRVLKMIRNGAIGKIRTIIAQWEPSGIQECGTHALDLCCFFSESRPHRILGRIQERPHAHSHASGTALIVMENGIECQVWVPRHETMHMDEIKIIGDEGFVRLGKFVAEHCRYETYGSREHNLIPVMRPLPVRPTRYSPIQNGLRCLLEAVETGAKPVPGLEEGFYALEMVIGSYVSNDTDQWVDFPLGDEYSEYYVL